MDDQKRPDGIPVTRFTLQSIYAQSDDEKLDFEYESGTMNIIVSVNNFFNFNFLLFSLQFLDIYLKST